MANSAEKMANSQDASFRQIISAEGTYVDYTTGAVCLANGQAVGSMDELKEHTDGTKKGIVDINGTPYEIEVNKDGTISALNEINDTADYATRPRTIEITEEIRASGLERLHSNGGSNYHRNFNGIDNVPYDGYRAILHKNERVLTAEENKSYSEGANIDYSKIEQCMRAAVKELKMEFGNREVGRVVDKRLRERGLLI